MASRVLRTPFLAEWDGREAEITADRERLLAAADAAGLVDGGAIWAGHASGLVSGIEPAADIVRRVAAEAEASLRGRGASLLR